MKKFFISPDKNQYKANLHCHSTDSDGKKTPEELKESYRSHGYSVLAISDHEYPKNRSHMNEDDLLFLTAYEAHIHGEPVTEPGAVRSTIHMNFFAKDPTNETVICYHEPDYKRYYKPETRDTLHMAGPNDKREYSVEYINKFIKLANENGYLVAYNHPVWSMEPEERILAYENVFSLEIDNYSAHRSTELEHSGALYDKILRLGKRVYCHGGDDNHNSASADHPELDDSFGAFTYIVADKLDYESVIGAMENGDMYASTGPQIFEISMENGVVHVECSPAKKIILIDGTRKAERLVAKDGETVCAADLDLRENARYFRISVIDEYGHKASSRGYFRDEFEAYDKK